MMTSNKSIPLRSNFFRTNVISLVIGFVVTFVLAVIISMLLVKVKCYERYYPVITGFLICVPSFIGAKISTLRINHMLLLSALFQGFAALFVLITVSGVLNRSFVDADQFITSAAFTLPSSLLAVFLPARKKKRH